MQDEDVAVISHITYHRLMRQLSSQNPKSQVTRPPWIWPIWAFGERYARLALQHVHHTHRYEWTGTPPDYDYCY